MNRIIIYTNTNCKACLRAKQYFRLKGYDFEERLITNREYLKEVQKIGGQGIPTIVIGDMVLSGFSPSAISSAIRMALKKKETPLPAPHRQITLRR